MELFTFVGNLDFDDQGIHESRISRYQGLRREVWVDDRFCVFEVLTQHHLGMRI